MIFALSCSHKNRISLPYLLVQTLDSQSKPVQGLDWLSLISSQSAHFPDAVLSLIVESLVIEP